MCRAGVSFFGALFRATAFFVTRGFGAAFFLTDAFLVLLLFTGTFAFAVFRVAAFCTTARFAFGRLLFGLAARAFAPDFAADLGADLGDERRATARDVERLRPLVTALISAYG